MLVIGGNGDSAVAAALAVAIQLAIVVYATVWDRTRNQGGLQEAPPSGRHHRAHHDRDGVEPACEGQCDGLQPPRCCFLGGAQHPL